jgi:hypothetical protein
MLLLLLLLLLLLMFLLLLQQERDREISALVFRVRAHEINKSFE